MLTISANNKFNNDTDRLFFIDKEIPHPDEVFKFNARVQGGKIYLRWDIKEGCYLYLDKFSFVDKKLNTKLDASFPSGKILEDEYFGRVEVFFDALEVVLDIGKGFEKEITATYQGCNKKGYCYTPVKKILFIKKSGLKIGI
tara:strand:- start:643 stop:1068 length:426 start_codon:yes stop_codon:yes gene_type:complete